MVVGGQPVEGAVQGVLEDLGGVGGLGVPATGLGRRRSRPVGMLHFGISATLKETRGCGLPAEIIVLKFRQIRKRGEE